jgi:hypothetical protein
MKKAFNNSLLEAILVFLIVLIAYGYFSSERDVNINSRLALVKAFVDEGRFEIDSYHNTELYTVDKSFFNGHYYSDKAIGTSLLGIFAYYPVRWVYYQAGLHLTPRLFREWITFLAVSFPVALLAPFLYLLLKQIAKERWRAFIIIAAICLGTPLFKYSTAFYGHALAALFYFLAFMIWFNVRQKEIISLPKIFISGILMGLALITEYPLAILLFTLALYILFILYQTKQLLNWRVYLVLAIGFILPITLQAAYNQSIYGTFLTTGYSYESNEAFRNAHASNLMGIGLPNLSAFYYQTFHPAFGIFWQSPVLFLSLIGWIFMARNKKFLPEFYFSLISIFLFITVLSGYYMWWGGVAFTPRHLIPILPLFALPLAFLPTSFSIPLMLTSILAIFQNLLITASGDQGLTTYIDSTLINNVIANYQGPVIYQVCLPNVINGLLTNNRGLQLLNLHGIQSLFPLLALEALLFLFFFKIRSISQVES